MKKVLSGVFALVFVLSPCVIFAAGSGDAADIVKPAIVLGDLGTAFHPHPAIKGSNKEVIVELISCGYSWSYTVDNEDMVKLVSQKSFVPNLAGSVPVPTTNRWHFEPLKKGDVTVTFTSPSHNRGPDYRPELVGGRKISYTYHIDSNLNMELVSKTEVPLEYIPALPITIMQEEVFLCEGY